MITKRRLMIGVLLMVGFCAFLLVPKQEQLPLVAIANYGPHASLDASIQGVKDALAERGFIENKTVRFDIQDVGFDASMIPQMIAALKNRHPKVMVVLTTPVAQFAKGAIKDIPLVFDVITDPIEAGLIHNMHHADKNMTGSSDKQDLNLMLHFAKQLISKVHTVGLLYAPAEANDVALRNSMQKAVKRAHMEVFAVPVADARDIALLMQKFKGRVDMIYVGTSGPVLPTLPVISSISTSMKIPVLSVDESSVKDGLVLGSFGINYHQVGMHAGELAACVLNHKSLPPPIYPSIADHHGYINVVHAKALGIDIPSALNNVSLVE